MDPPLVIAYTIEIMDHIYLHVLCHQIRDNLDESYEVFLLCASMCYYHAVHALAGAKHKF